MTTKHRDCSKRILLKWGFRHCSRNATVERNGEWYCWQHDPERRKAEAAKRMAAWQAEQDRLGTVCTRRARNAKLAALVDEKMAELLGRLAEAEQYRDHWRGIVKHEYADLGALVTLELAELLERLGKAWQAKPDDKETAREFAARIREALEK